MFDSPSANSEFIEIYNLSSTNEIDLSNYKIKYHTSSLDTIVSFGKGIVIAPHSYALILEGDYDISSGIYNSLIPDSALILKINNNAFGSAGMSNTTGRTLFLLNKKNDTIDIYTYSADNPAGFSDEKIYLDRNNSAVNWTNSFIKYGTPGRTNSAKKNDYEMVISSIGVTPLFPSEGDDISLNIYIKNTGLKAIASYSIEVFNDIDFDSAGVPGEKIYSESFSNFNPGDSTKINAAMPDNSPGLYQIIASVNYSTPNNTLLHTFITKIIVKPTPTKFNGVVINEIMYAPLPGEAEWLELYNQSEKPVNLRKWKVSDNSAMGLLSSTDKLLNPGQHIVLCKDSSLISYFSIPSEILKVNLPSLNNSGDSIVLSDSSGRTIDSLKYHPSWGGNSGQSLERIWPGSPSNSLQNWGTCTSPFRGSPGYENSICPKRFDPGILEIVFAPTSPIVNDQVRISTIVKNSGRLACSFNLQLSEDINLDSLSDKALEVSDILFLSPGDSLTHTFRFYINSLQTERAFSVKIDSENDQDTKNNYFYKTIVPGYLPNSVVINEIMYVPSDGEPEWVELFNTTKDTVNLKNWQLGDILTSPSLITLPSGKSLLLPHGYIVLAKDSSVFLHHMRILSEVLTLNLPMLNNDEDGIIIKDSRGLTIDSVRYSSSIGTLNGFSLERKSPLINSNETENWYVSKDNSGSTPGQINSISAKNFDLALTKISIQPAIPIQGDSIYASITLQNTGNNDIDDFSVNLYYKENEATVSKFLTTFPMLSLRSSNLLVLTSPAPVGLENSIILSARIIFPKDEDTTNNYLELKVNPGYGRSSIVINEVMYDPEGGEPEWFELLNNSDKIINLNGWSFSTLSGTQSRYILSQDNLSILPGNFLIITKDSLLTNYYPDVFSKMKVTNFKALGNSTDGIAIYDSWNNKIDSIKYNSFWGGRNGRSLERFSPGTSTCDSTNWASSISRVFSTPGQDNSVTGLSLYTRNSIIINEIMFDPASNNTEFVELFNNSNDDIDLADWQVYNKNGNYNLIAENNLLLPKGKFFVLAADSLIYQNYSTLLSPNICRTVGRSDLGFSNTEDRVIVKDAFGNVIDSVCYSSKWHNSSITDTKNKSLERVNPLVSSNSRSNWNTSISPEGASPGELNSIYVLNQKADKKFSVLPNPFSPDNDGLEDYTIINYNFDDDISDIRIKIFDSRGRLVRTLFSQTPGHHGSIIFDGLDEQGTPLRIGIYILLLEQLGSNSVTMETIKSVVVVARKL